MNKKILILGTHPFPLNRGCSAMCMAIVSLLKNEFPNSSIKISNYMLEDFDRNSSLFNKKYSENNDVQINNLKQKNKKEKIIALINLQFALFLAIIWRLFNFLRLDLTNIFRKNKVLKDYFDNDIILDLKWGDSFTDIYGLYYVLAVFTESLIAIILNRPYILLPQTIGPYNKKITKFLAKFILKRTKKIMVRERKSYEYLKNFGINLNKISLIPDTAFYLECLTEKEINNLIKKENISIKKGVLLIGLTLRDIRGGVAESEDNYKKYMEIMVKITEYLIKNYNAKILLIPHDGIKNSEKIFEEFINKIKNKNNLIYLNKKDYSTEELRGIISKCDLLLSAYMHASISALSTGVPTINFSYSHKAIGVFGMVGLEKFVIDHKSLTFDKLKIIVENALKNKNKLNKYLKNKMKEINKNKKLIINLINEV